MAVIPTYSLHQRLTNSNIRAQMRRKWATLLTILWTDICLPQNTVVVLIYGLATLMLSAIAQNKRHRYEEEVKDEKTKTEIVCKVKDVLDPGREVSLKREHNVLVIPQLPAPKWVKIGKVTSLRAYPLVSGKEYPVDECEVRFDEMYMFENGIQMRWDRSFVVIDDMTKRVITSETMPSLSKVRLSIEMHCLILQAAEMPTLCTELQHTAIIICDYWCCNGMLKIPRLICTDCGHEVAEWLSRFLKGQKSGIRLGYVTNALHLMSTFWYYWAKDCILYRKMQNEHRLNPFVNILNSVLISPLPYENMTEKLRILKADMKFCPNIIVSASNLYMKQIWEWIKIGDIIIKNVLPLQTWPRYNKHEMPQNAKYFAMGINCELHLPGRVKLNDNVYIHFPTKQCNKEIL